MAHQIGKGVAEAVKRSVPFLKKEKKISVPTTIQPNQPIPNEAIEPSVINFPLVSVEGYFVLCYNFFSAPPNVLTCANSFPLLTSIF